MSMIFRQSQANKVSKEEPKKGSSPMNSSATRKPSEPLKFVDPVFTLKDVAVSYGDFVAVSDVNMQIPSHDITAFIGPSGCGKSTLLRTLNRTNDRRISDYPDAFAGWNFVSSFGSNISVISVGLFFYIVYYTLVYGEKAQPYMQNRYLKNKINFIFENIKYVKIQLIRDPLIK